MRSCVSPNRFNQCYDWDVGGTRWQLVGLSLSEAYKALGLRLVALFCMLHQWYLLFQVCDLKKHALVEAHVRLCKYA